MCKRKREERRERVECVCVCVCVGERCRMREASHKMDINKVMQTSFDVVAKILIM